jgi:hypothetical protein
MPLSWCIYSGGGVRRPVSLDARKAHPGGVMARTAVGTDDGDDERVTIEEASRRFFISKNTVQKYLHEGMLQAGPDGRVSLRELVRLRGVPPAAPPPIEPPNAEELATFLLARLAEDEAEAQAAQGNARSAAWIGKEETPGTITMYTEGWRRIGVLEGSDSKAVMRHLLGNAPYYVGVDCRARRAVVEMWLAARARGDAAHQETLFPVLLQLAARYHQHEDFHQQAWRLG